MDDEEYDLFDEVSEEGSYARRFLRADLLVLGVDLARGISQAITSTLTTAECLLANHANYKMNQVIFHEEAAIEIETLISGDDE